MKLKIGEEIEKEVKVTEYMRLYWVVLVLGEVETTTRLADIYERGEIVEEDFEESDKLRRMFVTNSKRALMDWCGE